ncbi:MAG: peptidylprolyl isomerase [Methylacidiphilales bacterium]|nr:peptidylprolyl isomerase [Candidatus Methylacidiphilales bacterium]
MNRSFLYPLVAFFVFALSLAYAQPARAADPVVILKTNLGEIDIQLDPTHAPISTANFLAYVDGKFYDGTVFHRVVRGFVAQGGGFTADGTEKPTNAPIKNEASNGLHNVRGTISMARTNDPDSATSQFFLNFVDNSTGKLDPGGFSPDGYAVFGKIIKGMDVLDKMEALAGPGDGPPTQQILLISARRQ